MSTTKYINSAEVFGTSAKSVAAGSEKLPEAYDRAITVNAFMQDIKRRYADDFKAAKFVKLYFFTDVSIYEETNENTYGFRSTSKQYMYVRPEMLAFTSLGPNKKVVNKVLDGGLKAFEAHGLYFETHLPQRQWDDAKKSYVGEPLKDEHGNVVYKATREVFKNVKVNCLLINTKEQQFHKKAGKWDLDDTDITYYDWKTQPIANERPESKYMMDNFYDDLEQFESDEAAVLKDDEPEMVIKRV